MTLEAQPLTAPDTDALQHGINHIALSLDERRMATSDVDMNIDVIENGVSILSRNFVSENEKIRPTDRVRGLSFSPDGELLYVAASDKVWAMRISDGEALWNYIPPRSFGFLIVSPLSLDVSTIGDVGAVFDDGSMVVWDKNGTVKSSWRHNDVPRVFCFDVTGEQVVGSNGSNLSVWNVAQRRRKVKIALRARSFALDLSRTGILAAIRSLNDVTFWDISAKTMVASFPVGAGLPIIALHPTSPWIACGEYDRVRLIDFDGKTVDEYVIADGFAICLAFNRLGTELLVGNTRGRVLRFEVGGQGLS